MVPAWPSCSLPKVHKLYQQGGGGADKTNLFWQRSRSFDVHLVFIVWTTSRSRLWSHEASSLNLTTERNFFIQSRVMMCGSLAENHACN